MHDNEVRCGSVHQRTKDGENMNVHDIVDAPNERRATRTVLKSDATDIRLGNAWNNNYTLRVLLTLHQNE